MQNKHCRRTISYQFPISYLRIILPLLILAISLFTGCAEEDTLNVPLKTGEVHVYSGKYQSKGGIGKAITLTAPEHRTIVEREFEVDGSKRYLFTFHRGDERLIGLILTQQDDGLYAIFGHNNKHLIIPKNVKSGQSWKSESNPANIVTRVGGKKTFDTGLGKLEGREISSTTKEGNSIKLWINNTYGIIAIHYTFMVQGSNRTEADLVLKKIETMENPPETPTPLPSVNPSETPSENTPVHTEGK